VDRATPPLVRAAAGLRSLEGQHPLTNPPTMSCGLDAFTTISLAGTAASIASSPLTADVVVEIPVRLRESTRYAVQVTGAAQVEVTSDVQFNVSVTLEVFRGTSTTLLGGTQLAATIDEALPVKTMTPTLALELPAGDYTIRMTVGNVASALANAAAILNVFAVAKYVV
jgi:hypothetical protein